MIRLLKVSRLEGLTDGVFAIAMTILALDLNVQAALPQDHLSEIMTGIYLKLFIYAGSFIILGTLWIAMSFQIGLLDRVNRPYLWCHVFYLMAVCVIPFSSRFVAAYPTAHASITFYAINLLCASLSQFIICECARLYRLNSDIYSSSIRRAIIQRIFVAPPCYIAALILAHWNTSLAFALLILPTIIYIKPGYVDKFNSVE